MPSTLNPDAIQLEEAFFARENSILLEKLREEAQRKQRREALREALKIDDEGVIDALIALDVYPETAVVFSLAPLIAVAWADGNVSAKEREAILKAAAERGVEEGSTTCRILENWLQHRPEPEMMETWKRLIRVVLSGMETSTAASLRDGLLHRTRQIMEASGGFLGLGSKVSEEEAAIFEEIRKALD